jgi:hypothetical protein
VEGFLVSDIDATPRSRRAILGAALGGVAAAAAGALGAPRQASAANGSDFVLGVDTNTASKTTKLTSTDPSLGMQLTSNGAALQGTGQSGGVLGQAQAANGIGIGGYSLAASGTGRGVFGITNSPDGVGVFGVSNGGSTGVYGYSFKGAAANPANPDKVGVYGYATSDSQAKGVKGESTSGTGVEGVAATGTGVRAASASGIALAVSGRATFTRSGRVSVPANKRSVDVTVPGGLAPTTLVVATLETYRSGVWVTVARKNYPSTGVVRIYLNKVASTSAGTTVGWVAVN